MKTGWWKVQFDVTIDGVSIDFDELPHETKGRILHLLHQGCVAGAVETPDDWEPMDCADEDGEESNCEAGTYDCGSCACNGNCPRQSEEGDECEDIPLF